MPSQEERWDQEFGIFVDREDYKKIFEKKLEYIPSDRSLLINFYGEGGIGKTALIKELIKEIENSLHGDVKYAYIDFEDENLLSKEEAIFRIRESLGRKGLKFPLFDTAYLYYWEIAHPQIELRNSFNEMIEWAEIPLSMLGLSHIGQIIKKNKTT